MVNSIGMRSLACGVKAGKALLPLPHFPPNLLLLSSFGPFSPSISLFSYCYKDTTWDWVTYKEKRFNWLTVLNGWGGLRKLTIMADGEAGTSYMVTGEREREQVCRKNSYLWNHQTLWEFTHYHEDSMEGNNPHDSIRSHWFPPTIHGNYEKCNSRWDLGVDTAKRYQVYI